MGGVKLPWSSKEELGQNAVVKFGQMGAEYRCPCPLVGGKSEGALFDA